jgi:UDP-2,3-diacylglucosamine hydrolase
MASITDAAPDAVREWFARYGLDRMIHGHTHRPKVHEDEGGTRVVLGDWYEQGSVLRVDRDRMALSAL